MRINAFVVFFSVLCWCNSAHAQYGIEKRPLIIGISSSLGTTTKNSPFGYGLGIDLSLNYRLSDELAITTTFGYASLLTKDTSPISDYNFLPLKALVKVFPTPAEIYFSGTVGAGFGLIKNSKTAFIFGGGTGYQWDKGYDIGIKYEAYQQAKGSVSYQPLNGQFAAVFTYHF